MQDFGLIFGPIGISNTNALGQVYAGIMQWSQGHFGTAVWPVVSETWDGRLNDIGGFHVTSQGAIAAIDAARAGPVEEAPNALNRVARRAALGLARLGSYSGSSSGDLAVAFSTAGGVNTIERDTVVSTPQISKRAHGRDLPGNRRRS